MVTGKVEQSDGLWVYFKDEAKKKKMTADSVYVEWKSKKKSRMTKTFVLSNWKVRAVIY